VGTRILTVEDDERIRTSVRLALEDEGWTVDEAGTGEDAVLRFTEQPADVVLIDIMLPGIDGFDLCRQIRAKSSVPIVMVTARSDTHDVVAGLEAGADDYLTKPFAPKELSARIRALLRRIRPNDHPHSTLTFGDLVITPEEGRVTLRGTEVPVTKTEFKLLCVLAGLARTSSRIPTTMESAPRGGSYQDSPHVSGGCTGALGRVVLLHLHADSQQPPRTRR
jgi:DNA-binding response OmpR family regulator